MTGRLIIIFLWLCIYATNALDDKILIYDWNSEDEIIAEGSLYSTDQKDLVNNVPLGPNAAIVTVSKVVNKEAFLWRPSADMSLMGDALHKNIAWPIHKIQFIQGPWRQEYVSKHASPKVNFKTISLSLVMMNCYIFWRLCCNE